MIALDAFPGKSLESTVGSISFTPTETTTSTTYTMKVPIAAADLANLRLGLNGTADVVLEEKANALLVPASAISQVNGSPVVTVKENGKYKTVPVETGIENNGSVEVVSGVAEGTTVYVQK